MKSIIFALLIGCGKKAETTASTSTEAEKNEVVSSDDAQVISVSPVSNTSGGAISASPTNSIEIKAIVRTANSEGETEAEEEVLPLPDDADDINDTVNPD